MKRDMIDETALQRNKAVSLTFCWSSDMIDETAWQRYQASVSLTFCWWDETWLLRLPRKEKKQCHPLSVGHGMGWDWWDCLAKIESSVTHSIGGMRHDWWDYLAKKSSGVTHNLLVMGWDIIDGTVWQRNKAAPLTPCWSWDETGLMRLPGKAIKHCHSQAVGHGIAVRDDWWDTLAKK